MYYIIEEKQNTNTIQSIGDTIKITVEDFTYINDTKKLITKIIEESPLLIAIKTPKEILSYLTEIVLEDKSTTKLQELLIEQNFPLFSLIIGHAESCKTKYKKLKELSSSKQVTIKCNKSNLIKAIELAKKLNKETVIDSSSIPLPEYKNLLKDYDINNLDNITVYYQDLNSSISIKELVDLSHLIDEITANINKYNLSPLEKIIYVYDKVKSREYKKSERDKLEERNVSKVISGDAIVCAGYSNLFNALLTGLGISAVPLISLEKNHQRSIAYVNDPKYNIKGVYTFDPTWDRKADENDDIYIDNYNYFALTIEKSKQDTPSEEINYYNIPFEILLSIYNNETLTNINKEIKVLNNIEAMFNFIKEDKFSKFDEIMRMYDYSMISQQNYAEEIYECIRKIYNPNEINPYVFMQALYNTRLIEYYNGVVEKVDIEEIIDTAIDRASFQKFHYQKYNDLLKKALEMIKYESEIYNKLCTLVEENEQLKRKNLNIKLLKVLKSKKNNWHKNKNNI